MRTGLEYYYEVIDSLSSALWVYDTLMIPFLYMLAPIILICIAAIAYYNKQDTYRLRGKAQSYYYGIGGSIFTLFILFLFASPMGLDATQEFSEYKKLKINHECKQGKVNSFDIDINRDEDGYVTTIDYNFYLSGAKPNKFTIVADDDGIPVLDRLEGLFGKKDIHIGAVFLPTSGATLGYWIESNHDKIPTEDLKDWCYDYMTAAATL